MITEYRYRIRLTHASDQDIWLDAYMRQGDDPLTAIRQRLDQHGVPEGYLFYSAELAATIIHADIEL